MTAAEENVTENVKPPFLLKVLVVALGLAIVGMLGLIIMKVMAGDHKKVPSKPVASVVDEQETPGAMMPENLSLARPEGSELVSYQYTDKGLVLHFTNSEADVIIMVDAASGKESSISIPK